MAVYTEIDDDALVDFMATYDVGEVLSCKGIAEGIENSNFLVTTTSGPFILTLYEKRVDQADLPFFLDYMDHLASRGVPCPVPVKTVNGDVLRVLSKRPAALITFLAGMWPKRPTADHCRGVGEGLAMLHLAGEDFDGTRANTLGVLAWRDLLISCDVDADNVRAGLKSRLNDVLDQLESDWPKKLPDGIIHADLFPDNVFFRHGHLSGIIDFYFACADAYAYDIAICLNAWCFEPDGSFNITKARRLLSGYQSVRPLNNDEIAHLPILAQGAAMRFLLTRLYDWVNTPADAFVTPKNPEEYIQKLEFHLAVKGPESYGLDL